MSAKDHPNNAPGVPMLVPPALERFQIKYINPLMKPFSKRLPGIQRDQAPRPHLRYAVRDARHQLPQGQYCWPWH